MYVSPLIKLIEPIVIEITHKTVNELGDIIQKEYSCNSFNIVQTIPFNYLYKSKVGLSFEYFFRVELRKKYNKDFVLVAYKKHNPELKRTIRLVLPIALLLESCSFLQIMEE